MLCNISEWSMKPNHAVYYYYISLIWEDPLLVDEFELCLNVTYWVTLIVGLGTNFLVT